MTRFGTLGISAEFVRSIGSDPEQCHSVGILCKSMEPYLLPGDVVVIDRQRTTLRNDCVYEIVLDGTSLLKRVFAQPDGTLLLRSDNGKYRIMLVALNARHRLRVVGELIHRARPGMMTDAAE